MHYIRFKANAYLDDNYWCNHTIYGCENIYNGKNSMYGFDNLQATDKCNQIFMNICATYTYSIVNLVSLPNKKKKKKTVLPKILPPDCCNVQFC